MSQRRKSPDVSRLEPQKQKIISKLSSMSEQQKSSDFKGFENFGHFYFVIVLMICKFSAIDK